MTATVNTFWRTLWLACWTVGLLLAAMGLAFADWAPAEMNRTIDNTNYLVNRGCSGTLIESTGGYILTANHCVDDQYETIEREKISDDGVVTKEKVRRLLDGTVSRIMFSGSESISTTTYKVKLIAVDRNKDLALLQLKEPPESIRKTTPAKIACDEPIRGDTVYIVGNPFATLYSSVTKGIVSSVQRDYGMLRLDNYDQRQSLLQISGGVVGGNSGGAVYNDRGELVGVPVLAHRINEQYAFAVPLPMVKEFLKANKLEHIWASNC